jgi:hypothetical protein
VWGVNKVGHRENFLADIIEGISDGVVECGVPLL